MYIVSQSCWYYLCPPRVSPGSKTVYSGLGYGFGKKT